MKKSMLALGLFASLTGGVMAQEGAVPKGIPHLDHVFVIMMENHGYGEILHNPNARFINNYAKKANLASNYFAVAHPSLTNYLETVGGSNFGVLSDNSPDWHNGTCTTNLSSGTANTDNPPSPAICPIAGTRQRRRHASSRLHQRSHRTTVRNNIDGTKSYASRPRPRSVSPSPISWSRRERPGRPIRKACPCPAPIG